MKCSIIFCLLILSGYVSSAQSTCEKLTKMKAECYGFKPTLLTEKQQKAKSAQLDRFWELAKKDTEGALPCLRDMILAENNDPYFCFDAATLIMTLDKKEAYLDVVLQAVNKAELTELQLEPYLQVCFFLGKKGKDIVHATEKLISTPKAHVFLTVHVIDLSAIDASLFLYNTMSTQDAESSLINTITNGNATGRHNAAVILNILSTDRGDSLLNKLMAENKLPDSTSKFILNDRKAFISNTKAELTEQDEDLVRKQRQETIQGLSDEGLQRYFGQTGILFTIRNKKSQNVVK
jgi:hypothetical protein